MQVFFLAQLEALLLNHNSVLLNSSALGTHVAKGTQCLLDSIVSPGLDYEERNVKDTSSARHPLRRRGPARFASNGANKRTGHSESSIAIGRPSEWCIHASMLLFVPLWQAGKVNRFRFADKSAD